MFFFSKTAQLYIRNLTLFSSGQQISLQNPIRIHLSGFPSFCFLFYIHSLIQMLISKPNNQLPGDCCGGHWGGWGSLVGGVFNSVWFILAGNCRGLPIIPFNYSGLIPPWEPLPSAAKGRANIQSSMHPIRMHCVMGWDRYDHVMWVEMKEYGCMTGYLMNFGSRAPASLFISSQIPQTDLLPVSSPWCYPDRK